jgi:hypothetical protein
MGVLGAILVASNTEFSKYGFLAFLVSAILWATVAQIIKDRALLSLQITFMCVDLFGIYRWFFLSI